MKYTSKDVDVKQAWDAAADFTKRHIGWEVIDKSNGKLLFRVDSHDNLDGMLRAYCCGLLTGMDTGKVMLQEEIKQVLG